MAGKVTFEEFSKRVAAHPILDLKLVTFEGTKGYGEFICNRCGTTIKQNCAANMLRVKSCKGCDPKYHRVDLERVRETLAEQGCELLSDNYRNENSKLRVKFECGHTAKVTWSVLRVKLENGRNKCTKCSKKQVGKKIRISKTVANERLRSHPNGKFEVGSDYTGWSKKCDILCLDCGRVHSQKSPEAFIVRKFGCECSSGSTRSSGEHLIKLFLDDLGVHFVYEKYFEGSSEYLGGVKLYDFYLPFYNVVIEYDGKYHDQAINKKMDKLKDDYFTGVQGGRVYRISYNDSIVARMYEIVNDFSLLTAGRLVDKVADDTTDLDLSMDF